MLWQKRLRIAAASARVAVPAGSSRLPLLPVIRPWPWAHLRASAAQALTEALSAKPERSPPAVTS